MATRMPSPSRPTPSSPRKVGAPPSKPSRAEASARPAPDMADARNIRAISRGKADGDAPKARRKTPIKPTAARVAAAKSTLSKRGRPPKRVFINVLVRESTRSALTRLKVSGQLASQGEVIDQLVMQLMAKGDA
jgi:hypothetical protein